MENLSVGEKIADLRRKNGMKQEELAIALGVTSQAVSKWERGGMPDSVLLPKIADVFGVSVDFLFGRDFVSCKSIAQSVHESIINKENSNKFETAFEYCFAVERGLCGVMRNYSLKEEIYFLDDPSVDTSLVLDNDYCSTMRASDGCKYFFMMSDSVDAELLLKECDFTALFGMLADRAVFDTLIMLYRRDNAKKFTLAFLEKTMGYDRETAERVVVALCKFDLVREAPVDTGDGCVLAYTFYPSHEIVFLLLLASDFRRPARPKFFLRRQRKKPYMK